MVGSLVEEQDASNKASSTAAEAALRRPLAGRVPELKRFPCICAAGPHPSSRLLGLSEIVRTAKLNHRR